MIPQGGNRANCLPCNISSNIGVSRWDHNKVARLDIEVVVIIMHSCQSSMGLLCMHCCGYGYHLGS